jgi:ketosteroid isomerase-like protein
MHEDAAIREHIASMSDAIRAKDVDSLMTYYAPDVAVSDVTEPLDAQGADAYRKKFERWFSSMEGPLEYETHDLSVSVNENVGLTFCSLHVRGTRTNGHKADYWLRVSTEFQKVNGEWLVGHERISMPAEM